MIPHDVAEGIRIPATPTKHGLLPPRSGWPVASFRIEPAPRRSMFSKLSSNKPVDAATRFCVNNGRIRLFTSRNDDAQSSGVALTDATIAMDPHGFGPIPQPQR